MTELYIFSQDDKLLTIISESTGLISAPFRDEINSVASEPFIFTVEADVDRAKFVKEENRVIFRDKEGDFREFVIKELDDIDNLDGPQTSAICLPAWLDELSEHFVLDKRYQNKEAILPLNDALVGTRYIGEVTGSLGLASTNFYRLSSVDCIWDILKNWGGEFKDVVGLVGNKITMRKIIIKQRLGADNGARFEIDHNIEEIQRTVLSYPKTAMYGWGASLETEGGGNTRYIDFGDVVWSKAKGDPVDKPKGQKWVGDPDALLKYGRKHDGQLLHRFAEFSNQDYEDASDLLMATWLNLQDNTEPIINYQLSVDSFDRDVGLGDGAVAIDREFARPIEIQTRVIAIQYDLLDIDGTAVVEMGQFLDLGKDIDRELDDIRDQLNKPRPTPPIDNNSYPDIKPSTPANVFAVGTFRAIQISWDYDNTVYISHYEVYASQIKDFVPDVQHLIWKGNVSSIGHEVGSNETWYYRVRAVNTRGTTGDFSSQVSASSTRIDFIDMADEIQEEIDGAKNRADEAVAKADNATANANDAIAKSQEGFDAAQDALGKSNDADSKANQAIAKSQESFDTAQSAIGKSNEAFDKANDAFKDVTALSTKVNDHTGEISTIKQTATGLQTQVSNNKNDITTVTQLANGLQSRVTDAEGNISTLTQTSTQLNSTIKEVRDDLDNLEIGGRNYVLNSNFRNGMDKWSGGSIVVIDNKKYLHVKSDSTSGHGATQKLLHFKRNTDYTLSFTAFCAPNAERGKRVIVHQVGADGNSPQISLNYELTTEPKRYVLHFKSADIDKQSFSLIFYNTSNTSDYYITDVMYETGNKASDWREAPEDTAEKFSAINQTIDSIATRVQDAEGNITTLTQTSQGLQTRVSTAEGDISTLTQTSQALQSRIQDAEGNISTLTQTATSMQSTITNIKDDLDNLGGRNLIISSQLVTNTAIEVASGNLITVNRAMATDYYIDVGLHTKATVSRKIGETNNNNGTTSLDFFRIGYYDENKNKISVSTVSNNQHPPYTFKFPQGTKYVRFSSSREDLLTLKVEFGAYATDWSYAPEDLDNTFSTIYQSVFEIAFRLQDTEGNISTLTQTAQGLQTRVTDAEGNISSVTQLANAMQTRLTDAEGNINTLTQTSSSMQSTIIDLQGELHLLTSRNLIKGVWESGFWATNDGQASSGSKYVRLRDFLDLDQSETYTLSAYGDYEVVIVFYDSAESFLTFSYTTKTGTNSWTFKPPANAAKFKVYIRRKGASPYENIDPIMVGDELKVKLEKGGIKTDWTAAPEDVAIQSQISQLADNINLRVAKGDVINQINIDTSGILISGKKLILDGDVTVTGAFRVQNANIVSVDAAKMTTGTLNAALVNVINLNASNIKSGFMNVDRLTGLTATFVSTLWNGRTNEVQITGTGLATYSGGQRTSLLNGTGHSFYRNNLYIGHIGTSNWINDASYRGLRFGLENNANYMSWGFKVSANASAYTTMLSWHKTGTKERKGFNFSDDVTIYNGNVLSVRTLSTVNYASGNISAELQNYTWNGYTGIFLRRGSGGGGVWMDTVSSALISSGNAYIQVGQDGSGNYVKSTDIYNKTYTNTVQYVIVSTVGHLGRLASSRRYKLCEEEITLDYAKKILNVKSKTWFDKRAVEDYARTLETGEETEVQQIRRIAGLIAEDMHDEGLTLLVNYDDKGRPDGIANNAWVLHTPLIADLYRQNEDLLFKISKLENRINQLEESA